MLAIKIVATTGAARFPRVGPNCGVTKHYHAGQSFGRLKSRFIIKEKLGYEPGNRLGFIWALQLDLAGLGPRPAKSRL